MTEIDQIEKCEKWAKIDVNQFEAAKLTSINIVEFQKIDKYLSESTNIFQKHKYRSKSTNID